MSRTKIGLSIINSNIVQATTTTITTTTSNSFVTTSLSASITPSSSTSRVKITVTGGGSISTSGVNASFTITRGGSNIGASNGFCQILSPSASVEKAPVAISYIDSPATASSVTYAVHIKVDGSATASFPDSSGGTCVMILEEII